MTTQQAYADNAMKTKTTAEHTPGPWIAEHSGTGDASVIAKCGWKNKDGTKFEPIIIQRTSWANARLIAASPMLLALCRSYRTTYPLDELAKKADEIIAQAEGRE